MGTGEWKIECWCDYTARGAALCSLLSQNEKLNQACLQGRLEDARSALKSGADPEWRGMNPVSLNQLVHSYQLRRKIFSKVMH